MSGAEPVPEAVDITPEPQVALVKIFGFELRVVATNRGFLRGDFRDINGEACSAQESSNASQHALWLGQDRCPKCQTPTRMHLSREQAGVLADVLGAFARTGHLAEE